MDSLYNRIMRFIFNEESITENQDLVRSLEDMYNQGFPDANEREDFQAILRRVKGLKGENEPFSLMIIRDLDDAALGGLIADWYQKSLSLHLTYLIVDEKHRRQGIAKELVNTGIPLMLNRILEAGGVSIRNVYFESNNPGETSRDNFDPSLRIHIFSKMGAEWIDIPYVQPALDPRKKEVDNLLLFSIPRFNKNGNKIVAKEVILFLEDLYIGLGIKDLSKNKDFQKMLVSLQESTDKNGLIELKKLI